ncbi:MAG: hypothetical protein ACYDD4_12165 [Acidimicrobiales bacterium]
MQRRKHAVWLLSGAAVAALGLLATSGIALAASGGGYNPNQNDCPWEWSWNTPPDQVTSNNSQVCHSFEANVESGGTTNGDANTNNVRYAEVGLNGQPNDQGNPSFGFEENIGDPGTADSPHSGCAAVNTDGTGGGPTTGCGNNANGTGFAANYDYYQLYCPLAGLLPAALFGTMPQGVPDVYQCSTTPGSVSDIPASGNTLTIDHGQQNQLDAILTEGLLVYLGATDNLDNGEHDGFDQQYSTGGASNGASDGGALLFAIQPQNATNTPTPTNPEGFLNTSLGACADSICTEGTTEQQTVYYGCTQPGGGNYNGTSGAASSDNNQADNQCAPGTAPSTDAFQNNTPASTQESYYCNGGGPDGTPTVSDPTGKATGTEYPCYTNSSGTSNTTSDQPGCQAGSAPAPSATDQCGGANGYRQNTPQKVNTEPGVQTYEDPDPQRSPALPFGTPGTYVGTCGVFVNDGPTYEDGVSGTLTGGAADTTINPVDGRPVNNPGWVVKTSSSC